MWLPGQATSTPCSVPCSGVYCHLERARPARSGSGAIEMMPGLPRLTEVQPLYASGLLPMKWRRLLCHPCIGRLNRRPFACDTAKETSVYVDLGASFGMNTPCSQSFCFICLIQESGPSPSCALCRQLHVGCFRPGFQGGVRGWPTSPVVGAPFVTP